MTSVKRIAIFSIVFLLTLSIVACSGKVENVSKNTGTAAQKQNSSNAGKDGNKGTESGKSETKWPQKTITFVTHTGPGPVDTMTRKAAELAQKDLGVTIIIENRPGGGGAAAQSNVQSKPADGYTFVTLTSSTSFDMAAGSLPFGADDWKMVRSFQSEPTAIAVLAGSPFKTLDDFIKQMKADPKKVTVGGYGATGFHTFVYYKLQKAAGFKSSWVPFESGGEVATALLGKHIHVAVMTPSSALSQVKNGEIRLLAISSGKRSEYFPNVPTFKELGYNIDESLWRAMMVKKGTPDEIINKLNATFDKVINSEEWKSFMKSITQDQDTAVADELMKKFKTEVEERKQFLNELGVLKNKK